MAHLSRTERLRLIRALKAAGEHHLADRFADRGGPAQQDGLVIRSLRLHVQSSTLAIGHQEVEIPPAVTDLLVTLSALAGTPIGRTDLADVLDSWPARIGVLITHARRALGRLAGDGSDVLLHDRKDDTYWLSPTWPMLVVA